MENASTKVSLAAHPSMVKEGAEHQPLVIFTKENMDSDKPVLVVNIPPVGFIVGPSKQVITGNIQGYWDPYRSVAVVTAVGVPVQEELSYIGMNSKREVIHLEFYCDKDWLNSLEEGWRTQSVDQWLEWITRPYPEDEVPNIDWLISLFPGIKNYDGKSDPSIKSCSKPLGALKNPLKNICNLKR